MRTARDIYYKARYRYIISRLLIGGKITRRGFKLRNTYATVEVLCTVTTRMMKYVCEIRSDVNIRVEIENGILTDMETDWYKKR